VRDHAADYAAAGAVVLGVSRDPVERLAAFDDKHSLGFTLLSDADHAVAEAYGVWWRSPCTGGSSWARSGRPS
jgi:peroxiredoxin Q/BCP